MVVAQVAAAKANRYVGILKNTFVSSDAYLWKKLYTTYDEVPVWIPYMHKDIDCLEKIQHRATKIPHSLKSLQYPQRCEEMGLTSSTKRRERGDLKCSNLKTTSRQSTSQNTTTGNVSTEKS
jgi:ribonuclease P/MRP protein subunit RPP40